MTDADRIKQLERELDAAKKEATTLRGHVESLKKEAARRDKKRPSLDEMTLAEMEQLASRVSAAVAALREARPFMGGSPAPQAQPSVSEEAPPVRPVPPPIDHPRAKGKVVLSPEEEGRKRALLRVNRGDDVKESA